MNILTAFVIASLTTSGSAAPADVLLENWHGRWVGSHTTIDTVGKSEKTRVVVEIGPDGGGQLIWKTTIGSGPFVIDHNYRLRSVEGAGDRLVLDQQNGIVLPARRVGDVIYTAFTYRDWQYFTRYERRGENFLFEVIKTTPAEKTGKKSQIDTYKIDQVTLAILQRAVPPKKL